jgi:hypothetical protein
VSELVQVAVAGSVDEAEELQALLTSAGIAATLEGAVEEHPRRTATARCGSSCPPMSWTRPRDAIEALTEPDDQLPG